MAVKFYRKGDPYGCLSNFSEHEVEVDGEIWPTNEHYFQAMKFPHNPEVRELIRIVEQKKPMNAKRIANRDNGGLVDWNDWNKKRKDKVMLFIVRIKFDQHKDLCDILLSTGNEELIENSKIDPYWGCGSDGNGKNKLGKILMNVREEIKEKTK